MSLLIHILGVLIISYAVFALTVFFMQSKLLYQPMREISYTPEDLNINFKTINFLTEDKIKLNAWYIPAAQADMTILFCHGNGGNMMHLLDSINFFNKSGLNCFIFDYRGYGQSEGKPSEEGTYKDARAAYNWLIEEKKISPENIIIFGRSLGGSIASHLAAGVKVRSVVIESCFTSYVDIGKKLYPYLPVRLFARFSYDTAENLKKVQCPVMIIHSRNDEMVPFEFGLRLYHAANEPKQLIEISGTHNDGFETSEEIYKKAWEDWLEFLKQGKKENEPIESKNYPLVNSFDFSN